MVAFCREVKKAEGKFRYVKPFLFQLLQVLVFLFPLPRELSCRLRIKYFFLCTTLALYLLQLDGYIKIAVIIYYYYYYYYYYCYLDPLPTTKAQTGGINTVVVAGAAAAGVLLIVGVVVFGIWWKRRKSSQDGE